MLYAHEISSCSSIACLQKIQELRSEIKECYHGKTFYAISINKTDKGLKKWCLLCLEGWVGKGRGGPVYP